MRTAINVSITLLAIMALSCSKETNPISDAQQLAALKNVEFTYDSMGYDLLLPAGALDGKTFAELLKLDSSTYANPANYGVSMSLNMNADNTGNNARDAKFDGMAANIVMNNITSAPIAMAAGPFTIDEGTEKSVHAEGDINLSTHKPTGLYIFQQIVDGADLATTFGIKVQYKVGLLNGEIPLPEINKNIPTRASQETKDFLKGLLDSGIFEVE
jgi:hypothetical protein